MSQEFRIITKRSRLSTRLKYLIFPFVTGEFQNALERTGAEYFSVPIPRSPGPPPIGAALDWNGIIAKKGNTTIDFDSVAQVIGVEGDDTTELISVFSEVLDIVKAAIEPTIDENTVFYEFHSNYNIETGESPLERLGKIHPENNLNEKIKDIIQEPVSMYNFHIYGSNNKIQSSDWFDINIRPTTKKSEKVFDIMTVHRSKDKSKVDKFVSNYDDTLRKIFDELNRI